MMGSSAGVYVAQNDDIPSIQKLFNTSFSTAKHIEENYHKPKKRDDD